MIAAKKRGVDVRVILEWNVYGSPEINRTFYERLLMEWVPVRYANNHFFTFTHAKFWIIDDSFYISTGNFSYSAFATNRELIIFWKNVSIVTDLSAIFTSDTADRFFRSQTTPWLLVSPISMRSGITTLLQSATSSIFLYVQSFTDKDLIELLRKKSEEGIRITVCIADKWENDDTDDEAIETLRWSRIFIKKVKKPYPHLKFINIDSNTWFIGSTNLTQNALDNNREIWLIFHPEITLRDAIWKIPVNECPITKK